LTDNSLQSADKDQQESRAVTEKRHVYDAVVKLDTYRNVQRDRAVLSAIARLSCFYLPERSGFSLRVYSIDRLLPIIRPELRNTFSSRKLTRAPVDSLDYGLYIKETSIRMFCGSGTVAHTASL